MEALIARSASPLVDGPYGCEHNGENDFHEKHTPKKTQSGAGEFVGMSKRGDETDDEQQERKACQREHCPSHRMESSANGAASSSYTEGLIEGRALGRE